VSSIYIWSENSSPKSKAKMVEIEEPLDVSSSPFLFFVCAVNTKPARSVCAEISYFDIDLKNNTHGFMNWWISDTLRFLYDFHRYWTSISAILASLLSQAPTCERAYSGYDIAVRLSVQQFDILNPVLFGYMQQISGCSNIYVSSEVGS
jgi:hypothetical protein